MSKIVIDASVLIAVIINETSKKELVQLTQNADLISPPSTHWEIGNAFSAMLKRHRIHIEDAHKAVEKYQQIAIRTVTVELNEALKIANELKIYAYDAYLLRCAIKYRAPLLTLDKKLIISAKSINVRTLEVSP